MFLTVFLTKSKTETVVFHAEETLNVSNCFLDSPNPEKWTMMNIRQWLPITTEWQMRSPAQCLTLSILSKCIQNQTVLWPFKGLEELTSTQKPIIPFSLCFSYTEEFFFDVSFVSHY